MNSHRRIPAARRRKFPLSAMVSILYVASLVRAADWGRRRHLAGGGKFHMMFIFLALAGLLTAVSAPAPAEVKPDDAKDVQGMWLPAKAELGGQPMPDAVMKIISLKLDNGKYEVLVGDKPDKGTYTIDSASKPKGMTITGTEGPNKGRTFPAIYELNGDAMRICYDLSGAKRPTEFKSEPGTKLYLVTYHRKKE